MLGGERERNERRKNTRVGRGGAGRLELRVGRRSAGPYAWSTSDSKARAQAKPGYQDASRTSASQCSYSYS